MVVRTPSDVRRRTGVAPRGAAVEPFDGFGVRVAALRGEVVAVLSRVLRGLAFPAERADVAGALPATLGVRAAGLWER